MSVRYDSKEDFKDSINKILVTIFDSDKMYEINIREEKVNDIYENVDIKIRKMNEWEVSNE